VEWRCPILAATGTYSKLKRQLPREAPDCDLDADEGDDEGEEGVGEVLEILDEAAVAAEQDKVWPGRALFWVLGSFSAN
jgi:hypothetical protein